MLGKESRLRAVLLLAPISSLLLCSACVTAPVVGGDPCPRPNTEERVDYEQIVVNDPARPFIRWMGRIINHCFPEEAEFARGN